MRNVLGYYLAGSNRRPRNVAIGFLICGCVLITLILVVYVSERAKRAAAAREEYETVLRKARLLEVHEALFRYASDHDGAFPATIQELVSMSYCTNVGGLAYRSPSETHNFPNQIIVWELAPPQSQNKKRYAVLRDGSLQQLRNDDSGGRDGVITEGVGAGQSRNLP